MEKQLSFERLTENNYSPWSNMMKLYLKSIGAWKFIENAIVKPEQADEPLFYRASAIILMRGEKQMTEIVKLTEENRRFIV